MNDKKNRIKEIEELMLSTNFWGDSNSAQKIVEEYNRLKVDIVKKEKYKAIINIFAGTGGDDSEDFVKILSQMYVKYSEGKNFNVFVIDESKNGKGGYKNISLFVDDKKAYSLLKNESGVHRLVRISPFNSKKQRHTSFALVDVIPKLPPLNDIIIKPEDIEIDFTNSSGPGGQNVNKRETAVRVRHKKTDISVRVQQERSQMQNKELALEILRGKLFTLIRKQRLDKIDELSFDKTKQIEWGNQIRSYVLHPYKVVKDLRVDYEERDPDSVFDGKIDGFIEALREYNA